MMAPPGGLRRSAEEALMRLPGCAVPRARASSLLPRRKRRLDRYRSTPRATKFDVESRRQGHRKGRGMRVWWQRVAGADLRRPHLNVILQGRLLSSGKGRFKAAFREAGRGGRAWDLLAAVAARVRDRSRMAETP